MNTNYNTSIKGEYTFYDENMNVLSQTDNLITDWGMRRFVGDRSEGAPHPVDTDDSQLAFINNIKFIMLGTDNTTASFTNFQLISAIPTFEYATTNQHQTTGTLLSTDPVNQDLLIIFTRMTRFQMASSFNPSLAPTGSYTIREVGCNWATSCSANNRYGIFSRAVITPVTVRPNNVVFVKYTLTVKTDVNQVKNSMSYVQGSGANPQPNNKTNVRSLPLYTLQFDGTPSSTLNDGVVDGVNYETMPPLFEDAGSFNATYTGQGRDSLWAGGGSSYLGDAQSFANVVGVPNWRQRLWWLQMYTSDWNVVESNISGGANPSTRYNTFVSSTTANVNNSYNIAAPRYASGGLSYSQYMNAELNSSNQRGRLFEGLEELTKTGNIWRRKIRFLFSPNEFKGNTTVLNLYRASFGDPSGVFYNTNGWNYGQYHGQIYSDIVGTHTYGLVTVFDQVYNQPSTLYHGFEYNFTFIRN